ncbi:hypothetical protein [Streptomyces erythrochromogenes]|uniref:hypothetical protein n=1 Tax=Streptomyces erythrochromogenes TaxID=285574 RepID=UPI00368A04B8
MPERPLRKDRTAVPSVLAAGTPAEGRQRAVTAEPPSPANSGSPSLAAGDYWFRNDSTQDGESPNSSLHT